MIESVDNPKSERVRRVRALAGRSGRDKTGLFLVEGPQGVREAVRAEGVSVRELYLTVEAGRRFPEIVSAASGKGIEVLYSTAPVLHAMSENSQAVLAVVEQLDLALEDAFTPGARLAAYLVEVRDPGNAGTVLRAADAAGADAVLVSPESVDVYNPKVVRATAGSLFHLPVVSGTEVVPTLETVRGMGFTVLAASGRGEVDLDELVDGVGPVDPTAPTVWLFGNEARGLSLDVQHAADATVRIPLYGRAESLNLATAAAVCLYTSARAQRGVGKRRRHEG